MISTHRTPGTATRTGLVWALALWVGLIALAPSASAQVDVAEVTQVGTVDDAVGDATGAVGSATGEVADTVADTANTAGDTVTDVGSTAGDTVTDVGNTVGDTVGGDTGGTVSDTTGTLGGAVKDTTRSGGDTIKDTGGQIAASSDEGTRSIDKILGKKNGSSYTVPTDAKMSEARFGTKVKAHQVWNIRGMAGNGASFVAEGFGAFAPSIASQLGNLAAQTRLLTKPTLAEIARAAQEAIKQFTFPIALTLMVVAFMLAQGRLDRKDPKLALAAVDTDEDMLSFA